MFHFSYFKKSYISKVSKGACVEQRVKDKVFLQRGHLYIQTVMAQTTRYLYMIV